MHMIKIVTQVNFIVTQPKSSALPPGNENYQSLKQKNNNVFYPILTLRGNKSLKSHSLRWFGGWLRVKLRIRRERPPNRMQPVIFITICKL